MNGYITTKVAAERLNVTMRRVQALIAAGRLPAEKIGNSFAIREADLARLNGRRNGHPAKTAAVSISKVRRLTRKQILAKPPEDRTQEEWNVILEKFIGCIKHGPSDLSTNPKYMDGFGLTNAQLRARRSK